MSKVGRNLRPVPHRMGSSGAHKLPNAKATAVAFANLLLTDPCLNTLGAQEAVRLPAFLNEHRAVLLKVLLPSICECTRGGLAAGLREFSSGKSLMLYVDDGIAIWHVVESGIEIPLETRQMVASGSDFLSLLYWLRPALARDPAALSRCLALAATFVLQGRQH